MYQNTVREESPVEVTTPPLKPSRRREKRLATVRNEDTVRPNMARFCGVHANVLRRAHDSGAKDEDYFNKALLDYEYVFRVPFTLRCCSEILKNSLKWWEQVVPKYSNPNAAKKSKTSGSSSFNTESGDASFKLNVDAGDEDEMKSSRSLVNMTNEALARLMVFELATQSAMAMKKEERAAYM
nr:hypothetical protein [Tanacetum cinerariifolium]